MENITVRNGRPSDHPKVIDVVKDWWDGRDLSAMLPKVFFSDTVFVAEKDGELVGFLVAFYSQAVPEAGYIHFVGVHPGAPRRNLG